MTQKIIVPGICLYRTCCVLSLFFPEQAKEPSKGLVGSRTRLWSLQTQARQKFRNNPLFTSASQNLMIFNFRLEILICLVSFDVAMNLVLLVCAAPQTGVRVQDIDPI